MIHFVWFRIVFDVWGHLPPGDFKSDFGNFDECLNRLPKMMRNNDEDIRSQYCILNVHLNQAQRFINT